MAKLHDIVFDSHHPAAVARFWAAVLDGFEVAPYDDAELERLRSVGIDDPEDDPTVLIQSSSGVGPRIFFQFVPESKVGKNRVHLDLRADDVDAEVQRLTGLGARLSAAYERHITLVDPEGNEFCIRRD